MIKVQNLYKKYRFKIGSTINLEFGSRGFVVLLGSNESGNKTLLNIIGGLENFDSGDLFVNNTSLKSLTNENLNYYQNNYVGYILEDIGLFSHLTVSENLAQELEFRGLSQDEILKSVNEMVTRFNLQEIKNCKPNQITEQEKQRVKIAGVIAKDPKIILVNGKIDVEIMEMLKELSKEKLVIVATNDDNVKQYCDRIIEFFEREIVSDKIISESNLGVNEFEDSLYLKSMSPHFKSMFNFTRKWMRRNYIVTLFFILITLLFGLATSYGRYDTGKVTAKTIYDNDLTELVIQNGGSRPFLSYRLNTNIYRTYSLVDYKERSQDFFVDYNNYKKTYSNNDYYKVRRRWNIDNIYDRDSTYYYQIGSLYNSVVVYDDINQFKSSLIYGDEMTKSTDVYITDYLANIIVEISDEPLQMESLIGEEITVYTDIQQMKKMYGLQSSYYPLTFIIAGVIDTDYEHYDYLKNSEDIEKIMELGYHFDVKNKYAKIITSSENMTIIDNIILEDSGVSLWPYYLNDTRSSKFDSRLDGGIYLTTYFDSNDVVLLGNSRMPTSDNEVVIPYEYIRQIMSSEGLDYPSLEQLKDEQDSYLSDFMNKKFKLKYDLYSGTYEKELTIVGFYTQNDMSLNNYFYSALVVNDELYKDLYYKDLDVDLGIELGDDEKENIALFQSLDENYWYNTLYSDAIYHLESKTNNTEENLYKIAFALVLIPVVKEVITRLSKDEDRKKHIRTLQTKGINPTKFFIMRGLMAWLITSIIGYLLLSFIMIVINLIVTNMYNISYFLPYQNIFSILTVIVVALIIHFGVALKEIYHIKRMN